MSTALIHMVTPAFEMLTNPCLPSVFAEYPTFATLFAMIGIFMTHLVQVSANQLMTAMIHKDSKGKLKSTPSTASIIAEPDHGAPFSGKVKTDMETECEPPASPIIEHGVIDCHPDQHSHTIVGLFIAFNSNRSHD